MSSDLLAHGTRLGKYEVVAHIATGGMGAVYKAVDREHRRPVALKVLPTELARQASVLERFHREARHAARLNHPNIVALYESCHDEVRDLHYLVLEYIDGVDLKKYMEKRGRLHAEETRLILIQAATALAHAHEQGVVHRDIKPANFLLAKAGSKVIIKLTDMGLACREEDDDFRITREGTTVGTIDYLSPEPARDSASADIRSDIYSLGCTAYHMLAGHPPFAKGGLGERLYQHLETPVTDVREFSPKVSPEFWAVLERMLEKDPDDRYATPDDLLLDLKQSTAEAEKSDAPTTVMDVAGLNTTILVDGTKKKSAGKPSERETPVPPAKERARKKTPPAASPAPDVSAEQARAAAAYYERATQVLSEGGGDDYARQLLVNCLHLDPFNLAYRQALRAINHQASSGFLKRWMGSINILAMKSKLRLARTSAKWRLVLEHGEEILARQPDDADTHVEMAAAAKELRHPALAMWLLEQGREHAPDSTSVMRALAVLLEEKNDRRAAVALWEKVRDLDPSDADAQHKINSLLADDLISQTRARR